MIVCWLATVVSLQGVHDNLNDGWSRAVVNRNIQSGHCLPGHAANEAYDQRHIRRAPQSLAEPYPADQISCCSSPGQEKVQKSDVSMDTSDVC